MIRVSKEDFQKVTKGLFRRDINSDLAIYTRDSISSICIAFENTSTKSINSYQVMREYLVEVGIIDPIPITSIMSDHIDTLGSFVLDSGDLIGVELIPVIVKRNIQKRTTEIIDIQDTLDKYL